MENSNLYPILFYEAPFRTSLKMKIFYVFLFGIIIIAAHLILLNYFGSRTEISTDFDWYVGFVSLITLGVLLIATNDLRYFYSKLTDLVINSSYDSNVEYNKLKNPAKLVAWGIVLGLVIVLFAYQFGVRYESRVLRVSIFTQFFIVGFICGLAWRAVYWILNVVQSLVVNSNLKLDYFNPDSCAGTNIIGNILYKLAAYNLIIGTLILFYVWKAPWRYIHLSDFSNNNPIAIGAFILPFILTLVVFFYPMFRIHEVLKKYKLSEHMKLREKLNLLTQEIIKFNPATGSSEELDRYKDKYEQMMKIEDFLKTINTWPFQTKTQTISNTFVVITPILLGMANFIYSALHPKP